MVCFMLRAFEYESMAIVHVFVLVLLALWSSYVDFSSYSAPGKLFRLSVMASAIMGRGD